MKLRKKPIAIAIITEKKKNYRGGQHLKKKKFLLLLLFVKWLNAIGQMRVNP